MSFVLNVLAFVFIGLQIRPILASLAPGTRALSLGGGSGPRDGDRGADRLGHDARRAVAAARRAILDMRARDEIGDAAFHRLEEELDWVEMGTRSGL